MTEEMNTPGEQTTPVVPPQQGSSATDWEARYKGLVKKVEELTLANRTASEQLAAKTSELEQLRSQLVVKDAEKSASVGERDKLLQQTVQEKTSLEAKLAELQGLALKVEAITELGRPELLKIAGRLPNMTDKEALKVVLQDFAGFADELVQKREKDLLAGVTPPLSSAGNVKTGLPASENEWESHINSFDLGTRERQQAMDNYWGWLEQKHKS
jgi:vacuolar-type H+-ATPase subunit I/STV1